MAICGIKVRMDKKGGDDTSLNGARFQCCPVSTLNCTTFEPSGNDKYHKAGT